MMLPVMTLEQALVMCPIISLITWAFVAGAYVKLVKQSFKDDDIESS